MKLNQIIDLYTDDFNFLTHTVQMKLKRFVWRLHERRAFLTHTVQMKRDRWRKQAG